MVAFMRSLRPLVVVLSLSLPFAFAAACSSSSGDGAGASAGAAGAGGAGGAAGAGGGGASAAGGDATGGTDSGGSGAGTGKGGSTGTSLCKSNGDGAVFGFLHPMCGTCAQTWCDSIFSQAYGAGYAKGDVTQPGDCQAYETCTVACGCQPDCVTKKCAPSITQQCATARAQAATCLACNCNNLCGITTPDPDAGMFCP
jgi:hypothetical protein